MNPKADVSQRVQLFARRVAELRQLRLVTRGQVFQYRLSWDAITRQLRRQLDQVDEEDLRSFLLLFRQFVSQSEPVYINRIFNDCQQHLQSDHYREQLREARAAWRESFERMGAISVTINAKQITGEYALDLWINGHYFHNDSAKAEELRPLLGADLGLFRLKFLEVLVALTHVVLFTGGVVELAIRDGLFQFR